MKTIDASSDEKQIVFQMKTIGLTSDGVLELFMHKPEDNISGYLPQSSLTVTSLITNGKVVSAEIKVTIEEDPRIKAWSVFSNYAGRGVFTVKHCPDEIFVGSWIYQVDKNFHSLIDSNPFTLEFSPTEKKEIGILRGNEGRTNYPVFLAKYKTYYSLEDHVQFVKLFPGESGKSEDVDMSPRFALHSHNPACNTFYFHNFHPIPSEAYFLYGIFNDTSCVDNEARYMMNFSDWPEDKRLAWRLVHGTQENPSINPMEYPILLQTAIYSTNYLESGLVIEVTTPAEDTFGEYTVLTADGGERKGVKGFSHVTYPVGRWVVIHEGETHWYIIPTSDYYYKNVVVNSAGLA